ncbi:MAG: YggS family pyridoxal phosphate-dependent enzyme [Deltaproteobacteria bacterium]|nr:YggS family pyridoxal phosphate-dependent enzyme [Deltaproteobacteria bacterium]
MSQIADNLKIIEERIANAASKAGRNAQDIKLIAVSKTVDAERIKQAIEAGATILGENYIQEARNKIKEIGQGARWDFIGHLQSNKAKYAVDLFEMIHSVDRLSLAQEINRVAEKKGKKVRILVQVNISGEETKSGINPQKVRTLIGEIASMSNLSLEGLMTMPPYFDDPEKARPYFTALRELRDTILKESIGDIILQELSMGMSGDFEVAIEERSTMVRIGTAIFGERSPK